MSAQTAKLSRGTRALPKEHSKQTLVFFPRTRRFCAGKFRVDSIFKTLFSVVASLNEDAPPEDYPDFKYRGPSFTVEEIRQKLQSSTMHDRLLALAAVTDIESAELALSLLKLVIDDDDVRIRSTAVRTLGFVKCSESFDILVQKLACDLDYGVRATAAGALGYLEDVRAVGPLRRQFYEDENWLVQFSAATALGNLRCDDAVSVLTEALERDAPMIQQAAIAALGEIGCVEALPSVLKFLDSPDVMTRQRVAEALGRMVCGAAISALQRLEDDRHPNVRTAAKMSLSRLREKANLDVIIQQAKTAIDMPAFSFHFPQGASHDNGDDIARLLAGQIAQVRKRDTHDPDQEAVTSPKNAAPQGTSRAAAPFDREMASKLLVSPEANKRLRGVLTLQMAPPEVAAELVESLSMHNDQSELVRAEALFCLSRVPGRLHMLTRALQNDSDPVVRSAACDALVTDKYRSQALELLVNAYHLDDDWLVKSSAVLALGQIQDPRAYECLLAALDNPELLVKRSAITSLAATGRVEAVPSLAKYIRHENDIVRHRLAQAFAYLPCAESARLLMAMISDPEESVRKVASHSLQHLKSQGY